MVVTLSPNGRAVTAGTEPDNELLVGTIRGVVLFRRDGTDSPWREVRRSIENVHVSSVLREPRSGRIFVGGHGHDGLWLSEDDGVTWREALNGIEEDHVFTLAAQDRADGVTLFAGVAPPALYRSDDFGDSWQRVTDLDGVPGKDKWDFPPPPHVAHVKNISWNNASPDTIYVSIERGALLKSTDGAKTFTEIDSYVTPEDKWIKDCHRVVIRESNPEQLFLIGGEGVYLTLNGGETWEHVQTRHDRVGYPDTLVIDPHDESIVYLAGAGNNPLTWTTQESANANATVLKSVDGGYTWGEATSGLPVPLIGNIEAMSMHSHEHGIELFIGTATGEVYTSIDGAANWTLLAGGLPPISKVHHYRWFLPAEERVRIEELARR